MPWPILMKALAAKAALESARGGISRGGNPLALAGLRGTLAGRQPEIAGAENDLIPGVDRPPRAGLEGLGRTRLGFDSFWTDTDF